MVKNQESGVSTYSKCSRYAVDWKNVLNITEMNITNLQPNTSWPMENCKNGWKYNTTIVTSSIVIDVSKN